MKKPDREKDELLIYKEVISNALPLVFFTSPFKQLKNIKSASIRFLNKNLLKMLGYTDKEINEIAGATFKDMMELLVSSKDSIEKYFEKLIRVNKVEGAEFLFINRNGQKVAIHASSRCIKRDGAWYAQGIFTDKTPEKKLEREVRTSHKKIKALQTKLDKIQYKEEMVFSSVGMQRVVDLAAKIASLSTTILIQGETGTGKELIAKYIHKNGERAAKAFFAVNCGAMPETLLESELFGHVKGSFTGAIADRKGYFAAADGGTLFLDEIGELSPATQVKLLRVLEEQSIRPIGSNLSTLVNVRIVAATNRNLKEEINKNNFRKDLYYRLAILPINIPPLKERLEDILPLANYFIRHFSQKLNSSVEGISPEAVNNLLSYSWPGNVRELQNVIERAMILCMDSSILASHLLFDLNHSRGKTENMMEENVCRQSSLKNLELIEIKRVLDKFQGNRTLASKKLGISRSTLWRKLTQSSVS